MTKLLRALALLSLSATACNEVEYITLFDEPGTWALVRYDIMGTSTFTPFTSDTRRDKFLLDFVRTSGAEEKPAGKVAAASCVDINGNSGIESSQCDAGFVCRCFDYEYDGSQMVWREYMAEGGVLYEPKEGEAAPGDPIVINLSQVESASKTYTYKPLPPRLFDSDGSTSGFQFVQRAQSTFEPTMCRTACFGDET